MDATTMGTKLVGSALVVALNGSVASSHSEEALEKDWNRPSRKSFESAAKRPWQYCDSCRAR